MPSKDSQSKIKIPPAKESDIEFSICQWLFLKGYSFWKQPTRGYFKGKVGKDASGKQVMVGTFRKDRNPYVGVGVSDIIVIYKGLFVGLEVKSESGTQSKEQIEFEALVKRAGGFYFVVRSIEDAQAALRSVEEFLLGAR